MSRLLIITAWYHPFIHPRAHRWTALAEYWAAQGHSVDVLTARHRDCPDVAEVKGVQIHRAGFDSLKELFYFYGSSRRARGRVNQVVKPPGRSTYFITWLYRFFWKNIYFPDDAGIWYFPARKKALILLQQQPYDALITVSLPFTGHLIGLSLKKRFPNLRWLADIGDPFSIQTTALNNRFLYQKASRRLEASVLQRADAVTVTTAFTTQRYAQFFGKEAIRQVHIISPLLHPVPAIFPAISGPVCRIGYFGALYTPVRTPTAFLALLNRTFAERPDLRSRVEVHFFGEIFPEFYQELADQPYVKLHGLRPRAETQAAMQQMDILLNIGNQTDFQLPSKAVDYLAAGRPIVNLCYVEHDPFAAFLHGVPWLLNLKVEHGEIIAGQEDWLAWLTGLRPEMDEALYRQRVALYTVPQIAKCYQDLWLMKVYKG